MTPSQDAPVAHPARSDLLPALVSRGLGRASAAPQPGESGQNPESSSKRKRLARALQLTWCDPDATDEQNAAYRSHQYRTVVEQLPVSFVGGSVMTPLVYVLFHDQVNQRILLIWLILVLLLSCLNMFLWVKNQSQPATTPVSEGAIWFFTFEVAVNAALIAAITPYLFAFLDSNGKIAITGIITAYIGTGSWLYSPLPRVGIAWAATLCIGTVSGLIAFTEGNELLVFLIIFYMFSSISGVLLASRTFVRGLMFNTEAERQRQLVGLLLHDFEQDASDWLWETDRNGYLSHVSTGLTNAFEKSKTELAALPFIDLLHLLCAQEDAQAVSALDEAFGNGVAFADTVVSARVDGQRVWWSLTAKPLLGSDGQIDGWRGVGSDITDLREREDEMNRLANTDSLTGLANRHNFNNRLLQQFACHPDHIPPATLLILDLDGFKAVNDSFGHAAGDALLVEVSNRLRSSVREEELVARLGGDEFAVFIPSGLSIEEAERFVNRVRTTVCAPWTVDDHDIEIHASFGVAFAPADARNGDDLLKACDMALYHSKDQGQGSSRFFNPEMDARARDKLTLLTDLRAGIRSGEFYIDYQPQVDIGSGHIVGYEALVRWQHPTKGRIPPIDFIPLAEESGVIGPLGLWILNKACADATRLPPNFSIAVNVSGRQFSDASLLKNVRAALSGSGLSSHRLVIEVTESSLMTNVKSTQAVLRELRRMGVRVALDDFGTGYSSLSYLRTFPLDKLKIDRSFISSLASGPESDSAAIARAVVQLAQALRLETIAEGVETESQAEFLRGIGCTHGQGFLYSKPIDIEQAVHLSANRVRLAPPSPAGLAGGSAPKIAGC